MIRRRPAHGGQACRRPAQGGAHPAFTLLELLLALALIGLLATVLVTASAHLIGEQPVTPEDVFRKAVQQARAGALNNEREIRLSFDAKELAFVLDDGTTPLSLAVPPTRELTVDFLSSQPGRSTVLIGGELVDTRTVPFVTFYPDGTCSPFRVQFRTGGPVHVLSFDPWTCAPVLPRQDNSP